MKPIEIALKEGKAQVLTLVIAKQLLGKKIQTKYFGYAGQDGTDEFTIAEILSEYQISERIADPKHGTRARYWDSYMTDRQLAERKATLELVGPNDYRTYIRCHNPNGYFEEPTFTCSDIDREVYFVEI